MAKYDHARREQLAREKGFSSYREYRKATPEQRLAATERLARRDLTYRAGGKLAKRVRAVQRAELERRKGPKPGPAPKVGPDRRQIIPTPAGTILSTTVGGRGWGVIERRLERWADDGAGVTIRHVWVQLDDGRRVQLFRHGISVESFIESMRREAVGLADYLGLVVAATVYGREELPTVIGCQIVTDAM